MERLVAAISEGWSSGQLTTPQSILVFVQAECARAGANEALELINRCPAFVLDPRSDVASRVAEYINDFTTLKRLVPCNQLPSYLGECFTAVSGLGQLSSVISGVLARPASGLGEEYVGAVTISLQRIWEVLDSASGSRSRMKNKGESQALKLKCRVFADSKRPDRMTCMGNRVSFYGEEKKDASEFETAISELRDKVVSLPVAVYGEASFLICYAAAGPILQFFIMQMDKKDHPVLSPLTQELNINTERPYIVLLYVKLYFVLRAMRSAMSAGPSFDLYTQVDRTWSSVKLTHGGACKVIWDWNQFSEAWGVNYENVRNAYSAARCSDKHLIGSVRVPKLLSVELASTYLDPPSDTSATSSGTRKRRKSGQEGNKVQAEGNKVQAEGNKVQAEGASAYVVETIPLLAERDPHLECELRELVYGVLKALVALHSEGLVHRDIRLDNIRYNYELDKYVLIDLEGVSVDGEIPVMTLRCWDELTLTKEEMYTTLSDLYLLGLVMRGHRHLLKTQGSQQFLQNLLDKSFESAAHALEALKNLWPAPAEPNTSASFELK